MLLGFLIEHIEVGKPIIADCPDLTQFAVQMMLEGHSHGNTVIAACTVLTFLMCYEEQRAAFLALPSYQPFISAVVHALDEFASEPAVVSSCALVLLNMCMAEQLIPVRDSESGGASRTWRNPSLWVLDEIW